MEIERESDELISENDFTAREVDKIAKENKKKRWQVIDASKSLEAVEEDIWEVVSKKVK